MLSVLFFFGDFERGNKCILLHIGLKDLSEQCDSTSFCKGISFFASHTHFSNQTGPPKNLY